MRIVVLAAAALLAAAGLAEAGKVKVEGVHLCCQQCTKTASAVLAKVDGVADVKCEAKAQTITFTTKEVGATYKALLALQDAGFFGKFSDDGKPTVATIVGPKAGEKADEVTVKGVHVCCKSCQKAIDAIFKDAKVSYSGKGAMKEVKISGKGLEKAEVLKELQSHGFTGKVE